jgi:hypothetical protein
MVKETVNADICKLPRALADGLTVDVGGVIPCSEERLSPSIC